MPNNEEIFPIINDLRKKYKNTFFDYTFRTRDWHPANHCSFQANNPGTELFQTITLPDTGVEQVMWPVHCVQNSHGAEFHEEVFPEQDEIVIDKGLLERVDSYSGFGSPPEKTTLKDELTSRGVTELYCVGLAYDYCVGSTAVDGAKNGFKTFLITDATKSVADPSKEAMSKRIQDAGVIEITSDKLDSLSGAKAEEKI